MPTKVLTVADTDSYRLRRGEAAAALRSGKLVIFPTETVYGVGANAADPAAIDRLRELKGRASSQPFTVHIGRREDAAKYLTQPSPLARRLMRKGWPGPLTLVCETPEPRATPFAREHADAPLDAIFHEGSVGLRYPDLAETAWLLREAGVPIAASSANRSGRPAPFDADAAVTELGDGVEYTIDAGRTRLSDASTIVAVRGNKWELRRAGALDERVIQRMARSEVLFVCTGNSCRSPLAEYLFRQRLATRLNLTIDALATQGYFVSSAGTYASFAGPASGGTLDELKRRGIDASAHRSQPVTIELLQRVERVYVMSPEHRLDVLRLAPGLAARVAMLDDSGPVADPVGGTAADYQRAAEQIERAVERRVEEFVHEDRNWQ